MNYVNVFRTSDRHELSILKNLFDDENIAYKTYGEAMDSAANIGGLGNDGMRIEVEESERERAAEIIKRSGFLGQSHNISKPARRKPQVAKWVLVLLALLVVLVAIIFFIWFMSGN
ncbi:Putative signal transducing protein [Salegentibacter holothuriorum]|uniref:Putative signal transducing protein n=1 Tax=Salegentibacter holothuriorum TaxID=241145 RepID=A0A1T5BK44_9FLAO|nr:DUF2007 domain-containing protein [Salegentibacter holothuriorum]SKB47608.1 Putative signal transducing protein [Salegentibacter holothuriorum]